MDLSQMTAAQPVDLQSVSPVAAPQAEYHIGVGDTLDVRVFQVEDLSFAGLVVDTSGNINLRDPVRCRPISRNGWRPSIFVTPRSRSP